MERKRNIQPETERRRAQAGTWRHAPVPSPADIERRANTRHETAGTQGVETVRLVDLSSHGCCIGLARAADYRPGQFIRLGFPGENEIMRAIVRWTEGVRVGAEFTSTLSSDRIDAILGTDRSPMIGLL